MRAAAVGFGINLSAGEPKTWNVQKIPSYWICLLYVKLIEWTFSIIVRKFA